MLTKKCKYMVLGALLFVGFSQIAFAELAAVGPVLPDTDPGPGWSADYNGFPRWYRDTLGQTVELTVPPDPGTPFDPPDPANDFSVHTGFGAEAFWWDAGATIDLGNANQALLVLAVEAAYNTEDAIDGDQLSFARVRIRIDTPVAGTYRVTHPYGQKTFSNVAAGIKEINDTSDIGIGAPGDFSGALLGQVGPLLKMVNPAPPAGFLGDAATEATVTGSPTGDNFFRVERQTGPNTFVLVGETDQFVVSGKLFTGTAFTPTLATYAQDAAGATTVTASARSFPPAVLGEIITVRANAGSGVFSLPASGFFFFGSQVLTPGAEPPATVSFIGRTNGTSAFTLTRPLIDVVTIRRAEWSAATQTLTVIASSSDRFAPRPQLTLRGTGIAPTLVVGRTATVTGVTVPPGRVSVRSSAGGRDSEPVAIVP